MKIIKKIAAMAMIVAVAVTAGWNFYQNTQEVEMNELALANVDALANTETTDRFYELVNEKSIEIWDDTTGTYKKIIIKDCEGKGALACV